MIDTSASRLAPDRAGRRKGGLLGLVVALALGAGSCSSPAPTMSAIDVPPFEPRHGGAVWALGDDCDGRLGDGPPPQDEESCWETLRLAQVSGLDDVVVVRPWYGSVFAVTGDGGLWAWGDNSEGQLGDGTTTDRDEPVQVPGLSQVVDLTFGFGSYHAVEHAFAVQADGTVWTWQVGSRNDEPTPVTPAQITGIAGVTAVAPPDYDGTLWTLRADGTVAGWDDGEYCGSKGRPVDVPGPTEVVQVASWFYGGIALRRDGTVWAWSYDCYPEGLAAAQVPGLTDVAWLDDDVVLKKDGTVWALSTELELDSWTSVPVPGLSDIVTVSNNDNYGESRYAVRRDGSVWSWSDRSSARMLPGLPAAAGVAATDDQVGSIGTVFLIEGTDSPDRGTYRVGPTITAAPGPVVRWRRDPPGTSTTGIDQAISVAGNHGTGFAVLADGTVLGWGDNDYGQLATGSTDRDPHPDPAPVNGLTGIASVVVTTTSVYALDADGLVWGWGGGALRPVYPTQVPGIDQVTKLSAWSGGAVALRQDGTVWSWSSSWSWTASDPPAPVPGLTDVVDIGQSLSNIAVRADGTVWSWSGRDEPQQVPGIDEATALVGSDLDWWFIAMADGTVWALSTHSTQLETADFAWYRMEGLTDVVKIVEGSDYLALRTDGSVWTFATPGSTFLQSDQTVSPFVRRLGAGPLTRELPAVTDLMMQGGYVYAITNV